MLNKKITWRKQHKWLGIGMSFFMLMFCLSGILLNHRSLIKDVDVSRKYLPSRYEFKNWNGGLLRGTFALMMPYCCMETGESGKRILQHPHSRTLIRGFQQEQTADR